MLTDGQSGLIRDLQEWTAGAFPPRHLDVSDGWWLRYAEGEAWWASSVLPHGDAAPADLPARIAAVQQFYADRGAPARFQLSPGVAPAGLDSALAARGYRVSSPMSLRTAPLAPLVDRQPAGDPQVRVDDRPTDAWFDTWHAVHAAGTDPDPEWAMLRRVGLRSGYASVPTAAGVVAVGRAVLAESWAGVFGMATRPTARGAGAAGRVLDALARWAAEHGATHLYLQVEPDNTPARRLYDRAGFTELCRYHYRTAGPAGRLLT